MNWLERAARELQKGAAGATAITAERYLTAVIAVPIPGASGISHMSDADETAIRRWLAHIEEPNADAISDVLNHCRADPEALAFFLRLADEARAGRTVVAVPTKVERSRA